MVLGAWQLCMLANVANTLVDSSQEPMHTASSGLLFPRVGGRMRESMSER